MPTSIFWLNAHLFQRTILQLVYRSILYNDMERYGLICQYIRNTRPDIVMMSEVWSHSLKAQFAHDLSNIYPYSWIPEHTRFLKLGPEFVILSKHPISNRCYENFTNLSSWDWFSEKKICGMTIDNKFYCCSHLDTSTDCIYSNLTQVSNFIQQHSANMPVVFATDANISELAGDGGPQVDPEYTHMIGTLNAVNVQDVQRALYHNAIANPLYTVDGNTNTFLQHSNPGYKVHRRIDYFFGRNVTATETAVVPDNFSDHFGITMTIS